MTDLNSQEFSQDSGLKNFSLSFAQQCLASGVPLHASKLCPPFAVSWSFENGTLCDCSDLTEPFLKYRLHFMPVDPVSKKTLYSGDIAQADAVKIEWFLKEWGDRILGFNSCMERLEEVQSPERLMSLISQGKIPKADVAVIPIAAPTLERLLLRLGAHIADDCVYDYELPWDTLVKDVESGRLIEVWRALEIEEGHIDYIPERNPHLIEIKSDEMPGIFAAFYNNACSPGASAAVRLAQETLIDVSDDGEITLDLSSVGSSWHEMSVESATLLFQNLNERDFDYFRGRRMKLYLGTSANPNKEFSGESFDQCAFPGAARFLVQRFRETGEVSACLEYYVDEKGLTHARRPERD